MPLLFFTPNEFLREISGSLAMNVPIWSPMPVNWCYECGINILNLIWIQSRWSGLSTCFFKAAHACNQEETLDSGSGSYTENRGPVKFG